MGRRSASKRKSRALANRRVRQVEKRSLLGPWGKMLGKISRRLSRSRFRPGEID